MPKRRNEVKTAVYSIISNVPTIQTTFISQKPFELIIYVLDDCAETIIKVQLLSEN